mgnify:CR=1 FL=1
MKITKTLFAALSAGSLLALSAPAFADNDQWHYEKNRSQYISFDKAAEIAAQAVKNGRVKDVEFDKDWKGDHFDVEVFDENGQEYEVIIDAKTGKVLSNRRDD